MWTTTSAFPSAARTRVLDLVGGGVRLDDALVGRDADDEVGEVAARGVARAHPPQLERLAQAGERRADLRLGVGRGAVHQDLDRLPHEPHGQADDEHGDREAGDRVALRVAGGDEDRPGQDGERAGEVGGEVDRVGRERGRAVAARGAAAGDRAAHVDRDHDRQHEERPPRRLDAVARACEQAVDGLVADRERDEQEEGALGERREVLRLAVAVVVLAVGRAQRDADREQRQQRGHEVGRRVGGLGEEGDRAGGETRAELERDEEAGGDDAEQRGPSARAGAGEVGGRRHAGGGAHAVPSPSRSHASSARAARPRCEIASFSVAESSAIVRPSATSAGRNAGS